MASDLIGKIETDIELKASAEKVYDMFCNKPPQRPSHPSSPIQLQGYDLLNGDWGKEGAIICWNYTFAGEPKVVKQKIESVDGENKSMSVKVIEGDLVKEYKSLVITTQVSPKSGGDSGSIVHWTAEYEKLQEGVAVTPEALLQFGVLLIKDADAYLV